jgi:predicted cupin superfamily sugar epimerase
MTAHASAQELIDRYALLPHPEGGWYRELHRSSEPVRRVDGQQRSGLTAILFLLDADSVSRWHRVCHADETWHVAGGDPLELLLLPPDGGQLQRRCLAPLTLAARGPATLGAALPEPLVVVPAGWWQAARSLGSWTMVSCCVAPGFDFSDFHLLRDWPAERRPAGALPKYL